MRELLRRAHYLLNRRRLDRELEEEMAFHREMAERGGGVPVGDSLRLREDCREAWGLLWLEFLSQDVRYALRGIRRSPLFSAAAIAILAIGIGATVAAFSAFNALALRPLPVRDPESLLRFERRGADNRESEVPFPAVAFYREHARTLAVVLARATARLGLDDTDRAPSVSFVTANFFDELGARPALGRLLGAGDVAPEAPPAVVLGHGYWARQFGGDPGVVGRTVRLNGTAVTIVGVVAREFSGVGGGSAELWALIERHGELVHGSRMLTDFSGRQGSRVEMWGRLAPGATPRMAEEELASLAAELRRVHPAEVWEGERLPSAPGGYARMTEAKPVLALLGALVLLILVVACGNLGSLLLARGAARHREMALRVAIGAGSGRLMRQLLTESLVLALLGSLAGLVVGAFVFRALLAWTEAPAWIDPTPDWRVASFAIAMGFVAALLFGLTPARFVARQSRRAPAGRSLLIGAQVASSCVLLVAAGLLTRALDRATSSDPGFDPEQLIVVEPALADRGFDAERARAYLRDLGLRIGAIAGVERVGLVSTPPLGELRSTASLEAGGRPLEVYVHEVDPGYLAAMGIPLVGGRNLVAGDDAGVVVSESLARRLWPGGDPLGQPLEIGGETLTLVGLAGSARTLALGDVDAVELYRTAPASAMAELSMVVRTSGPSAALYAAVTAAAQGVDPNVRPRVALLEDQYRRAMGGIERGAVAVSLLGLIALALACLGVVGLVAYSVAQHRKEIGIRLALGAGSRHVLEGIARQFRGSVTGGLIVGILAAAGLAQLLRRQLYGVSTVDPLAYAGAVGLFVVAVALSALVPARRALRVDPAVTLRVD